MSQTMDILTGKWLLSSNPDDFSPTQVLDILMEVHHWRESNAKNCTFIQMNLDKSHTTNSIQVGHNELYIKLADQNLNHIKPEIHESIPLANYRSFPPILNKITLIYPSMLSDKRWKSIKIPTTWLFLGSALQNANFQVETHILSLPAESLNTIRNQTDILALTLYEDTQPNIMDLLKSNRSSFQGLIAAGGPFITLNPLKSAFHLPEVNLMIRGEAEFAFPELLQAINTRDLDRLFKNRGFLFRWDGFMVISDYDQVNHPQEFKSFHFNLDFLRADQCTSGLELNTSRGCNRSCLFCSQLQGKRLRKIPLDKLDQLFELFSLKLKSLKINRVNSRTVNINDDDLLQDPSHTQGVLDLIRRHQFKLWGIQASINSFFSSDTTIDLNLIDILSDRSLFVNRTPLLWIGTDSFIKKRGRRLGKKVPDPIHIEKLIHVFEDQDIQNYHYWISSDSLSDWSEFTEEFLYIYYLKKKFNSFHVLAHSPFLIPYSSTPVYQLIINDPKHRHQLRFKNISKTIRKPFDLILVDRVETGFPNLNKLLHNESLIQSSGFFDYLKSDDLFNAMRTIYAFLRQDRLAFESIKDIDQSISLKQIEKQIESKLGELMIRNNF